MLYKQQSVVRYWAQILLVYSVHFNTYILIAVYSNTTNTGYLNQQKPRERSSGCVTFYTYKQFSVQKLQ